MSTRNKSVSPQCLLLAFCWILCCSFAGIQYEQIKTERPQSIHVLEVDPSQCIIKPVRAHGRESVASLARRHGAVAAINGGFFSNRGVPCGILKIDEKWYGLPLKPRGAIGWTKETQTPLFDRLLTQTTSEIHVLPQEYTLGQESEWEKMDYIVGGCPLLLHEGYAITEFSAEQTLESFLTQPHARTAVGVLPNGHWIFVVVDGKQPDFSVGMTIDELRELMEELGCLSALNLDGGGSSTMIWQSKVVNQPIGDEDEDENQKKIRKVSDAFIIIER